MRLSQFEAYRHMINHPRDSLGRCANNDLNRNRPKNRNRPRAGADGDHGKGIRCGV